MTRRRVTDSAVDTVAVGEELGRMARPGWLVALRGDMGAGKTTWVRGFVRGVGSSARVHSPTFSLLNLYSGGRSPVYHLDLYRLNGPDEIQVAGLGDFLAKPPGISVVEWIERWSLDWPPDGGVGGRCLGVTIRTLDEQRREIEIDDFGARILI